MDNISETNINIKFDYDNFHELVKFAIADSLTIDGKKISKGLDFDGVIKKKVNQLASEIILKAINDYQAAYALYKDLPQVDRLETELLEKDFEINYLKKQIEFLEGSNANNG